jgi:hypothetical protein
MGESPEIPIPMPEPPAPGAKVDLVTFFPFGLVLHIFLTALDFVVECRFLPPPHHTGSGASPLLWTYFPFGTPAQICLEAVDFVYVLIRGK